MTTNSKARDNAEANFKKRQRAQVEGAKAMAEYHAEAIATRERTIKLRQARLAAEAARQKLESRNRRSRRPRARSAPRPRPVRALPEQALRSRVAKPAKPRAAKPNGR